MLSKNRTTNTGPLRGLLLNRTRSVVVIGAMVWAFISPTVVGARIDFTWPTPNPAWEQGRSIDSFLQPTVSGDPRSGLFGCVRSSGHQFHEGIDIKALRRDSRGEATDEVRAAMSGIVRHVSHKAGDSSYGRYVVIEHPDAEPAVYTLYAHLARIDASVSPGARINRGAVVGIMGRSAGGYTIPRERAHLHFEIGLRSTDDFQSWFTWRKFGSPNQHGVWNGMNLMGIDPLDFLREWRGGRVDDFRQYFDRMKPAVRVRVVTSRVPDFIRRYPALLQRQIPAEGVGGWEVHCNATGLPYSWTPLTKSQVKGMRANSVQLLGVDSGIVNGNRCRTLVRARRGGYVTGPDLDTMLQLVFGLR